jgi:Septum formation inhibitor MinC, C-terminal domain
MGRLSAKKRLYRSKEGWGPGDDPAELKRLTKAELVSLVSKLGTPRSTEDAKPCISDQVPTCPPMMLVNGSVRSGQTLVFREGDLIIVGSVGSGAEIVAGGSIHIYGALRGRAYAGTIDNTGARIFCQKLEAELLAIGGMCIMSDDLDSNLRGRAAHAWRESDDLRLAPLINPEDIQATASLQEIEMTQGPHHGLPSTRPAAVPRTSTRPLVWAKSLAWARQLAWGRG